MINLSRRKLIVSGLAATAGASGLAVAARLAQKYGLVPPDHGGIYGLGETLTYASQRLLTRHSLAREFPRNRISPRPFPNELAPPRKTLSAFRPEVSRTGDSPSMAWWLNLPCFRLLPSRATRLAATSPNSRVKRAGPTSPSGLACLSPTSCILSGSTHKPDTSCMSRWNPIRGIASIWPMLCIRRHFSVMA